MRADGRRVIVWLAVALGAHLLLALLGVLLLIANGRTVEFAASRTAPARVAWLLHGKNGDDSWRPMLLAYDRKEAEPARGLYDIFFEDGVKFQYPPSSLLFFDL